jgi:hypothetical protein
MIQIGIVGDPLQATGEAGTMTHPPLAIGHLVTMMVN